MAEIINNRYTVDGVTFDAKTGQQVGASNSGDGINPTSEQLQARRDATGGAQPGADLSKAGTPGYDVFGNKVNQPEVVSRYTGPGTEGPLGEAGKFFQPGGIFANRTAPTAEDEAKIREEERARVQAQIDAINELAEQELADATVRGRGRLGSGRSVSAATGTLGSPTGDARKQSIEDVNAAERTAIRVAKEADISTLLTGVENRARDIIQKRKEEATTNAQSFIDYLSATAEDARSDMTSLATAGADLSATQRARLIEQTGYDPETFDTLYKSLNIANSPDVINKDKPVINEAEGKLTYIIQVTDPETGAVSFRTETLDIPKTAKDSGKKVKSTVATADGIQILFEDGTYSKIGDAPVKAGDEDITGTPQSAGDQIVFLKDTISKARLLAGASGASGLSKKVGDFLIGDTKFNQLTSLANTLRTNVLTLVTDPSIKKFFGPQMSEADVRLMTAGGTTLNPELQSPELLIDELDRLEDLFDRIAASIPEGEGGATGTVATEAEYDTAEKASVGTEVTIGGVKYMKNGADQYDPI